LREQHRWAVIEMGASALGEIDRLARIAFPGVGVITNAAHAHLEGFGSIGDVASAKGELVKRLPAEGAAVLNRDDPFFDFWAARVAAGRVLSFGLSAAADYRARDISESAQDGGSIIRFIMHTSDDELEIRLPMAGVHNVMNALAAAAAATAMGAPLEAVSSGLAQVSNVPGRLCSLSGPGGALIFDDSYNANPDSVRAAIRFLAARDGQRWLVLGDMGELGVDAESLHREVGAAAREAGIDRLFCTGELSRTAVEGFGAGAQWCDSVDALATVLRADIGPDVSVLIKASRFMGLDRLVGELQEQSRAQAGEG